MLLKRKGHEFDPCRLSGMHIANILRLNFCFNFQRSIGRHKSNQGLGLIDD